MKRVAGCRLHAPNPGWWLDLDGPFPLDQPLTLSQLRQRGDDVRAVLEQLKADHAGSLYFPFFFWGGNELRPMQPYLNKLPAELVDAFPQLVAAAAAAANHGRPAPPPTPTTLGGALVRKLDLAAKWARSRRPNLRPTREHRAPAADE